MKRTLIVAGGMLRPAFLRSFMENCPPDEIIAADRGLDALAEAGTRMPDLLVGDFDSTRLDPEKLRDRIGGVERYPKEKDFSDLESALHAAITRGSSEITVLGATGGRLDHFLAAVMGLLIPLEAGIPARIVDEQNVIRLAGHSFSVKKEKSRGTYLSLIPLTQEVRHVTLRGFYYDGEDLTLTQRKASYGISNEIIAEEAYVEFQEGILIVVESADGDNGDRPHCHH